MKAHYNGSGEEHIPNDEGGEVKQATQEGRRKENKSGPQNFAEVRRISQEFKEKECSIKEET
jgi:hypothetical protein